MSLSGASGMIGRTEANGFYSFIGVVDIVSNLEKIF